MAESATLVGLLEQAADHPQAGLRFIDRREQSSYRPWSEIHSRARAVAGGLAALGVARGERVVLIYPTGIEFFDAFFGILLAGAVPVPLYPPVRLGWLDEYHERTAAMVRGVEARLVLADRRVRRLLGPAIEGSRPPLGCRTLDSLASAETPAATVEPEDLAMVQYSSGTTVDPRPVALSHRAVLAQTVRLNGFWPDGGGVRHSGASWLPLYHDMGLIGCVFPALERPAVLTLIPPELFVARPAVWLRTISRFGATISPAPNFAYGLCVDKIADDELEGVDLSSWKVALNGAEPVAAGVLRAFQERFAAWGFRPEVLTPVYGLSEAALAVTFSRIESGFSSRVFDRNGLAERGHAEPDAGGAEIVSVGRPLPDFEVAIVDNDGSDLPPRRVGRVMVSGPSLMSGYLGQPLATARALRDGWLDTGDLGFMDGGELYLTGRAKDVIILRGRNYSPVEVEHALDGVVGIRRGCVAAVSYTCESAGREVLVVLAEADRSEPRQRYPAIARAGVEAVRAATGLEAETVEILEPGSLPRTSSGKIRRHAALGLWRNAGLLPPDKVTPLRLAGALARSSLALRRLRREGGGG